MSDPTNPDYYANHTIQPMDVIEDWILPHHLACALKYFARYREKGQPVQDLRKAKWYLDRFIALMEQIEAEANRNPNAD